MTSSAYTVRYAAFLSFYLFINFILFLIVKNDDMRIFVPKVPNAKLKYVKKIDQSGSKLHNQSNLTITEICEKNNISAPLIKKHFLYNEERKTMYCWLRKVASTSFTKFFSDLENRHVTGNYYKEIHALMPKSMSIVNRIIKDKNVFKFIVVRHPFERLVSSYRDRIEDNSKYTAQAWIFAKQIFRLTRPHLMIGDDTTGNTIHQIYDEGKRLKIIPSFAEFVRWLLTQNSFKDDPHWAQYAQHCSLCKVNYDKIFRLENNKISELELLFLKVGLINDRNVDLLNLQQNDRPTNFQRACQYFKELSQKDVIHLYKRYRIDFEMFQYNYKDYLKCASREN